MAELHLICKGGLHVKVVTMPIFESGNWAVEAVEANNLIGGRLYLHERKAQRSYFGGSVESWRYLEGDGGRIVFRVLSDERGRDVAWKGARHGMAWSGGVIE